MHKVFVDGNQGTTGLRIVERLSLRDDIELLILPEDMRKDVSARKEMLNECDIAFLCLPDSAAAEAVKLIENDRVVVIDTSTAHRTAPGWTYGFPELSFNHLNAVRQSKRIANPGCHASGFIAIVYPLVKSGLLKPDTGLTCFSLTGYSGGGKKMISQYENEPSDDLLAPRQYGLSQKHKHLPEMITVCSLEREPVFIPIVSNYFSGMEVTVPLFTSDLKTKTLSEIRDFYKSYYNGGLVKYSQIDGNFTSANHLKNSDIMEICVNGNDERITVTARFDNLGKGASGAAIENMNIILGKAPSYSLNV